MPVSVLCPLCKRKLKLRTTRALKKLKAQGVKLGSNHPAVRKALQTFRRKQRVEIVLRNKREREKEKRREKLVLTTIKRLRKSGNSIKDISIFLNKKNIKTKHGYGWHPTSVYRLMQR